MPQYTVQILNHDGTACTSFYGPDDTGPPTRPAKWNRTVESESPESAARDIVVTWNEKMAGPGGIGFRFPVLVDVVDAAGVRTRLRVNRVTEIRYPVDAVPEQESEGT